MTKSDSESKKAERQKRIRRPLSRKQVLDDSKELANTTGGSFVAATPDAIAAAAGNLSSIGSQLSNANAQAAAVTIGITPKITD